MCAMNNVMDLIIRCAETDGWSVDTETNHAQQKTEFTFSKYTPAGQDFSLQVTMQDDDLDSLIGNIKEYYDNLMWIRKPTCGLMKPGMAKTVRLTG